eukprot:TRINITY_DN6159_c0_g1_i1.p1 TRINITY_DN6159_c0_g1~~TRINITY_DN6159_c0_g1_i1.p1  ORF type:complete len:346 (+),score=-29.66 TRINITY_DN6159_c0_g1_i1:99-1136(+)
MFALRVLFLGWLAVQTKSQLCMDDDFGVLFGGPQPYFKVSRNGTCQCPNNGFAGRGTLLTGLDQTSAVKNVEAYVSALHASIASTKAMIQTLTAVAASQQPLIDALLNPDTALSPASSGLALSQPSTTCLALKIATPGLASGIKTLFSPSGNLAQFYCDMSTDTGGWTQVWKAASTDYASSTLDYFPGSRSIIAASTYMMFAFADANNVLTQAWKFPIPPAFMLYAPMSIEWCNYNVINATRISDGHTTTQILRAGYASFGGPCDDSCTAPRIHPSYPTGYYWGAICLKSTTVVAPPTGTTPQGYLDFPYYSGFAVAGYENCARSDQTYSATSCTTSRLFTIFVR